MSHVPLRCLDVGARLCVLDEDDVGSLDGLNVGVRVGVLDGDDVGQNPSPEPVQQFSGR